MATGPLLKNKKIKKVNMAKVSNLLWKHYPSKNQKTKYKIQNNKKMDHLFLYLFIFITTLQSNKFFIDDPQNKENNQSQPNYNSLKKKHIFKDTKNNNNKKKSAKDIGGRGPSSRQRDRIPICDASAIPDRRIDDLDRSRIGIGSHREARIPGGESLEAVALGSGPDDLSQDGGSDGEGHSRLGHQNGLAKHGYEGHGGVDGGEPGKRELVGVFAPNPERDVESHSKQADHKHLLRQRLRPEILAEGRLRQSRPSRHDRRRALHVHPRRRLQNLRHQRNYFAHRLVRLRDWAVPGF